MSEKENLREKLFYAPKNAYRTIDEQTRRAVFKFADGYKDYLDKSRTERDCVFASAELAEAHGFVPYSRGLKLTAGDRVYTINRNKSILLAVIGKKPMTDGVNILAAHIDSPRLDLKPMPVSEEKSELVYFKTHYYGGIKKYQWTAIPLELRGVVALADGGVVNVSIGADPGDPIFTVTDLLPHLASKQMTQTLADGVTGENLRVLIGSIPDAEEEGADLAKLAILKLLYEKYGIVEQDFLSAELSIVPNFPTRDVGLDRSMIGGYGHDDRCCAYPALSALLDLPTPEKTAVCILADKEEIGSVGATGMQSEFFDTFISDLCGGDCFMRRCYENSACLSADVTNAYDPLYADVCDPQNSAYANYGVCFMKYTGARGKSGSNDAEAEFVGRLRGILDKGKVIWQMAELGRVDAGGGGTVAGYMSRRNISTIDIGVPVLSMHSPFEVISKLDLFMALRAMLAFCAAAE